MVNSILLIVVVVSLIIWLVQETVARTFMRRQMDILVAQDQSIAPDDLSNRLSPSWNEWLFKVVLGLWFAWVASVILLKDGDFALILVVLTFFCGIVSALDRWLFAKGRDAYTALSTTRSFLEKYSEEKRQAVKHLLTTDFVIAEYAKSFFPVLAVVLVLRSFVVEPFQIPSASMVPTLQVGDYILVNKFTYGIRLPVIGTKIVEVGEPKRGDVMVFFPPHDSRYFIKRVIGLPGDQIRYHDKQLFINGVPAPQQLIAEMPPLRPQVRLLEERLGAVNHLIHHATTEGSDFETTVKPGHYFMVGDNRDNSSDSRFWGQVPEANIVGKAFAIWMHWGGFTELPSFSRVGGIH